MKCPRHVHSGGMHCFIKGGIEGCNRLNKRVCGCVEYIHSPAYVTIETNTTSLVITEDRF